MGNSRKLSANGLVIKDQEVLLVRHMYGLDKGKLLIPGGFCIAGEMPQKAVEREVLEETGVVVRAGNLLAVRFTPQEVWCIFLADYLYGEPRPDQNKNGQALFVPVDHLLASKSVTELTRELVRAATQDNKPVLQKSNVISASSDTWQLFL